MLSHFKDFAEVHIYIYDRRKAGINLNNGGIFSYHECRTIIYAGQ